MPRGSCGGGWGGEVDWGVTRGSCGGGRGGGGKDDWGEVTEGSCGDGGVEGNWGKGRLGDDWGIMWWWRGGKGDCRK